MHCSNSLPGLTSQDQQSNSFMNSVNQSSVQSSRQTFSIVENGKIRPMTTEEVDDLSFRDEIEG